MNMLGQMTWGQSALAWSLILVCGFLMLVILIQRGRGGGLSGAFGGGGGGGGAFGAKTGDVFTWITVVIAVGFAFLAVVANFAFDQSPRPAVSIADVVPFEAEEVGDEGAPEAPAVVAPETAGETGGDAVPDGGKETVGGSIIDQVPTAAKTTDAGADDPAEKAQDPPAQPDEGSEAPTEPSAP